MSGSGPDKSQRYEELRLQAIDDRRTPGTVPPVPAVVLARQGMGTWMQLQEPREALPPTGTGEAKENQSAPPAPEQAELLAVLTGLVFTIRSQKESA